MKKTKILIKVIVTVTMGMLLLPGCANDNNEDNSRFDLEGIWTENVGWNSSITTHIFSFDNWKQTNTASAYLDKRIVSIDNTSDYFIYRENDADGFNPGKYGKVYWIEPINGSAYYCMIAYGKNTIDEAVNAPITSLVTTAPDTGGCGGFSWSKIRKQ